jgi:cytochrome c5
MTILKLFNKKSGLLYLILIISGAAGFVLSLWIHGKPSSSNQSFNEMRTYHSPISITEQLENDPNAGEKIFKSFCAACHANPPAIEINAPLIGDEKAWEKRKNLGTATLLLITQKGIGAMPARGGCFECSDKQLQETIDYILKQRH